MHIERKGKNVVVCGVMMALVISEGGTEIVQLDWDHAIVVREYLPPQTDHAHRDFQAFAGIDSRAATVVSSPEVHIDLGGVKPVVTR